MSEKDFLYYLYKNYKCYFEVISIFHTEITIKDYDIYLRITYTDYTGELLPVINLRYNNEWKIYERFGSCLNRINEIAKQKEPK